MLKNILEADHIYNTSMLLRTFFIAWLRIFVILHKYSWVFPQGYFFDNSLTTWHAAIHNLINVHAFLVDMHVCQFLSKLIFQMHFWLHDSQVVHTGCFCQYLVVWGVQVSWDSDICLIVSEKMTNNTLMSQSWVVLIVLVIDRLLMSTHIKLKNCHPQIKMQWKQWCVVLF